MPWKQGESGNLKGRPPKERALTRILERAGSRVLEVNGKRISSKRQTVKLVWEGLATGRVTFPDGRILELDADEWTRLFKDTWVQVDGAAKQELDLTSKGEQVAPVVNIYLPDNNRDGH